MAIPKWEDMTIALGVILKSLSHIVKWLLPSIKSEDNFVWLALLEAVNFVKLTVVELDLYLLIIDDDQLVVVQEVPANLVKDSSITKVSDVECLFYFVPEFVFIDLILIIRF